MICHQPNTILLALPPVDTAHTLNVKHHKPRKRVWSTPIPSIHQASCRARRHSPLLATMHPMHPIHPAAHDSRAENVVSYLSTNATAPAPTTGAISESLSRIIIAAHQNGYIHLVTDAACAMARFPAFHPMLFKTIQALVNTNPHAAGDVLWHGLTRHDPAPMQHLAASLLAFPAYLEAAAITTAAAADVAHVSDSDTLVAHYLAPAVVDVVKAGGNHHVVNVLTLAEHLLHGQCVDLVVALVVELVERDDMPVVGDIVWTAIVHHRQYTLDRLTNALLARDLLDVAARATCAAVDRGNARDAAVGMTPAIVGAVVAGRGAVVAGVAHKVVGLGYAELLLQLLLSLVHAHHAEALGPVSWHLVDQQHGQTLAQLTYLLLTGAWVEEAQQAAAAAIDAACAEEGGGIGGSTGVSSGFTARTKPTAATTATTTATHISGQQHTASQHITHQYDNDPILGPPPPPSPPAPHPSTPINITTPIAALARCLALGIAAAIDHGASQHVAAVNAALVHANRVDVCHHLAAALVHLHRNDALGAASWAALQAGRSEVVVHLGCSLIPHGETAVAAAANVALAAAAGGPVKMAGPAAGGIVEACKVSEGCVWESALLTVLLIEQGHLDLVGHVAVASVMRHHHADVLGRVSWCLLQDIHNGAAAVTSLSAWLLKHKQAHVAAEITAWTVVAAGSTDDGALTTIAGPLARAVATAVNAKKSSVTTTVVQSADLMRARGLGGLLRLVNTHLADMGRADVASIVLQHAVGMGKLQLVGVLGGELLIHGDVKTGVQIAAETLRGVGGGVSRR